MFKCIVVALFTLVSRQLLATDWHTNANSPNAFVQPIKELSDVEMDLFTLGRSFFTIPWVAAPSATTARDGLGPLFNANTCMSCHINHSSADFQSINRLLNQHSASLNANDISKDISKALSTLPGLVIKLGQPSQHATRSVKQMLIPDPTYGSQIGVRSIGKVKPEGQLSITLHSKLTSFADGELLALHYFTHTWQTLNYGPLDPNTTVEIRQAPALVGLGLLEYVAAEDILARVDAEDQNGDGISGKANWVYEPLQQSMQLGRFGYKSSQANVMMQTADAAAHDMGLTTLYFPQELCTNAQIDCQQAPPGRASSFGDLDLPALRLTAIAFYLSHFKAPVLTAHSETMQQGRALFSESGCHTCHTPNLISRLPDGRKIAISPYSDLLLHDMGEALAGGRAEFLAEPSEWKTTPLWGLNQRVLTHKRYLHDGRASSITEAIVWHGGEATKSRDTFMRLSATQRQSLISFLETL